jgi:hypothetical protein
VRSLHFLGYIRYSEEHIHIAVFFIFFGISMCSCKPHAPAYFKILKRASPHSLLYCPCCGYYEDRELVWSWRKRSRQIQHMGSACTPLHCQQSPGGSHRRGAGIAGQYLSHLYCDACIRKVQRPSIQPGGVAFLPLS